MRPDLPHGAVVSGSYTWEALTGNTGILQWPAQNQNPGEFKFGLNVHGLPNMGIRAAVKRFKELWKGWAKPLIVSIAGFSVEEIISAVTFLLEDGDFTPAAIEINISCPNKKDPPISFSYKLLIELFSRMSYLKLTLPVWIKFSPLLTREDAAMLPECLDTSHITVIDSSLRASIVACVNDFSDCIAAVVSGNTVGGCIYRENGSPVTTPFDGKAGLSGPAIADLSLKQAMLFREHVSASIDVIRCGGVWNGKEIMRTIESGLQGAQLASRLVWTGEQRALVDIVTEDQEFQDYLFNA
jgi:dihydroorotate dehydrogenase